MEYHYVTLLELSRITGEHESTFADNSEADFFFFHRLNSWQEPCEHGNCRYFLVGGLEHFFFFHILGIVTPTD